MCFQKNFVSNNIEKLEGKKKDCNSFKALPKHIRDGFKTVAIKCVIYDSNTYKDGLKPLQRAVATVCSDSF
jgi:hypothetical protein